jgi:hypothetical protein
LASGTAAPRVAASSTVVASRIRPVDAAADASATSGSQFA